MMLMLHLCGERMTRFTSSKDQIIGNLIQKKNPPVDESYPRPISNWDGIPNHLNAAMQYHNGNTYFFKDGQYYRFDENTFAVDKNGPSYPRDTGAWWFGCGRDDSPRRLRKKNNSRRFILD